MLNDSTLPSYLDYTVTYSDDVEIAKYQALKVGESETYKVRVEYKKYISNNDLESTDKNITITFDFNYTQSDSNMIEVDHKYTGTSFTFNVWDGNYATVLDGTNDSLIWLDKEYSRRITYFGTANEVLEANNPDMNNLVKRII